MLFRPLKGLVTAAGGTPDGIVRAPNAAVLRVLGEQAVQQRLAALGTHGPPAKPGACGACIAGGIEKRSAVVRGSGATVD